MNTHSTSIGLSCSSGLTGRARVAITHTRASIAPMSRGYYPHRRLIERVRVLVCAIGAPIAQKNRPDEESRSLPPPSHFGPTRHSDGARSGP
jgi:hypothetical protein